MFCRVLRIQRVQPARNFATSSSLLAGHNKWSKIKDKKGATDTQKSLLYNKASKDVIVAARVGGSADPAKNAALAALLEKYKKQGVPRENLSKALAKADGSGKGNSGESVTYEAIAFGSVGVIVECLTDNATRTLHQVRHALTRHEARMTPVKFMFQRQGCVKAVFDNSLADKEKVMEDLIEAALLADAEDFDQQAGEEEDATTVVSFLCPPEALAKVSDAVTSFNPASIRLQSSELIYGPIEATEPSEELAEKVEALVEELENDEDVLRVWTSLDA